MISIVNINEIPSLQGAYNIQETFEKEVEVILRKPLGGLHQLQWLQLMFSCIDYTSLTETDTAVKIEKMATKVAGLENISQVPYVAALCVYSRFAPLVRRQLKERNINIACVAGGFPSGELALTLKLKEVEWAIQQGATEIDVVISREKLLGGKYQEVFNEISSIKEVCKAVHLKVILETGELKNNKNIRIASDLAMYAGADFIKTSTGKTAEGATYNAVYVMLSAINDFYQVTGKKVGIKPSGGISTVVEASNYLKLAEHLVGEEWLFSALFRFGASSLANNVLNELAVLIKQPDLVDYFLKD